MRALKSVRYEGVNGQKWDNIIQYRDALKTQIHHFHYMPTSCNKQTQLTPTNTGRTEQSTLSIRMETPKYSILYIFKALSAVIQVCHSHTLTT